MDALLQTLLGGALALAGGFIAPYFQREHERWMASRADQQLLRDKAQELFDELDQFIQLSQQASLSSVARMQDKTVEVRPVPDLVVSGRLRQFISQHPGR